MNEPLGISSLWAETLDTFRRHRTILLTLAAAFIFLPQFAATLALEAAGLQLDLGAMLRGPGGLPDFPAWFGPLNILLFLVQLLALIPVTRIALGLANPDETVGAMIANAGSRLPGFLKAVLVLILLYVVLLVAVLVPLALLGAVFGGGRTGPGVAPAPGASAMAAFVAAALIAGGLYLAARLVPWFGVLVAENPGARASIRRAWNLTRGRAGRILLIVLVLLAAGLVATVVVGGLGYALGAVGGLLGEGLGRLLAAAVNGGFAALLSLLYYIFIAHLYRRLAT